jgi:hypothetical protein
MAVITKLGAAHAQLTTAIRMYFQDDDLASIHTLACAAREIYEKHCEAGGIERMFEQIEAANPERTTKDLWRILNGARNFLKHPDASMDLSAALELDDEMNAAMLWVACHDCAMLSKEAQPPEVQAYVAWFLATRFPREFPPDSGPEQALEILAALDRNYPELKGASPGEQKRIGMDMLRAAQAIAAGVPPEQVLVKSRPPLPADPLSQYLRDIPAAMKGGSPFSALALTLALPDICGSIEYAELNRPNQVGERYRKWCDEWAKMVTVSGADCYALRCAYLHNGTDEFRGPAARLAIFNRIEFTFGQAGGGWLSNAIPSDGGQMVRTPHETFCRDMIGAAEGWRRTRITDPRVTEAIAGLMSLRPAGARDEGG